MARETIEAKKLRLTKIIAGLQKTYPDAHCELNYSSPLELLVATILSAKPYLRSGKIELPEFV